MSERYTDAVTHLYVTSMHSQRQVLKILKKTQHKSDTIRYLILCADHQVNLTVTFNHF